MSAKWIIPSLLATVGVSWLFDNVVADRKLFGGKTPRTVASNEWYEVTDKKFQAWPRTAGPPVIMNPHTRQNFFVKSGSES